jgi:hypothetical protein
VTVLGGSGAVVGSSGGMRCSIGARGGSLVVVGTLSGTCVSVGGSGGLSFATLSGVVGDSSSLVVMPCNNSTMSVSAFVLISVRGASGDLGAGCFHAYTMSCKAVMMTSVEELSGILT